jgi:hypothetical protein
MMLIRFAKIAFRYESLARKSCNVAIWSSIGRLLAEQRCKLLAKIAVGKAGGASWKNNSAPQSLDLRISEAKRGHALRFELKGAV